MTSFPTNTGTTTPPEDRTRRWLLAAIVLLVAALVLTFIAAGEGAIPGDTEIARAIQQPPSPQIEAVAQALSAIGGTFPPMALMAVVGVTLLALRGRRDLALFFALAAALRALNPVMKVLINSPRPTLEAVVVVGQADGLGFPSGHALGAALFFGAVAVIVPQVETHRSPARILQTSAAVLMVLIAWSRVRLGVHWPSDVAGGLLFGLGFVCLLQAAFFFWEVRFRT